MSTINPGDVVTVRTNPPFSVNGTPTDPTTVKLLWRRQGQPPTVWTYTAGPEIVRDSAGTFHADIPILYEGTYYFRWQGSGGVTAAEESSFESVSAF